MKNYHENQGLTNIEATKAPGYDYDYNEVREETIEKIIDTYKNSPTEGIHICITNEIAFISFFEEKEDIISADVVAVINGSDQQILHYDMKNLENFSAKFRIILVKGKKYHVFFDGTQGVYSKKCNEQIKFLIRIRTERNSYFLFVDTEKNPICFYLNRKGVSYYLDCAYEAFLNTYFKVTVPPTGGEIYVG